MSDLPELDQATMGFVLDLMKDETASDAYRKNFSVKEWQSNSIWTEASKLKNKPEVQLWLTALRDQAFEREVLKLEKYIGMQLSLAKEAKAAGNYGAAANCLHRAGQASGLHTEKLEVVDTRTEQQLKDQFDALMEEARKEGLIEGTMH